MNEAAIPDRRSAAIPRPDRPNEQGRRRFMVLRRAAMAGFTALVTVNIWTGCPLLALWVGSQAVGPRSSRS